MKRGWAPAAALGLYFLLQLPGLTALPVFVDESFYLQQAQMVRRDPVANAFVSLEDPKPPLHIWLLALFLGFGKDPVRSGRLLSIAAGALTVATLFPLCRLLVRLGAPSSPATDRDGRVYAAVSALLVATCPYLAFYDRLALPDVFMVLAGAVVAWLSLRLAQTAWSDPGGSAAGSRPSPVRRGLELGLVLGLALFTRQYFSYVLWFLPPLAFLLWPPAPARRRSALSRFLQAQLVAAAVALVIWSPFLLVKAEADWSTRVLYHERYLRGSLGPAERIATVGRNALTMFAPLQQAGDGRWRFDHEAGWFWTYLTPPIAVLSLAGFLWLVKRREWKLAAFLGGWALATCAPLVLFASVLFPRYGVAATVPLLLAAARPIGFALQRASTSIGTRTLRFAALSTGLAFLVGWPVAAVARQSTDWSRQRLVAVDRSQYLSGWPAGWAVRRAIAFLRRVSAKTPVVVLNVVTDSFSNLAVAVAFEDDPAVRVYHADWAALVASAESWRSTGRLVARRDFRHSQPFRPIETPPGSVVLIVRPEPLTVARQVIPESQVAAWGRFLLVERFTNPRAGPGGEPAAIRIERIR